MTADNSNTPASHASAVRTIGFVPLLAVFYGYTAGGPFGYESIFSQSGPGMALLFLTFVPLFWSIPMSFASAELNSILPVQGGFYRWSRAAFGDFWGFQCGWWNWAGTFLLNSLYGVLVMDYLVHYFPGLTGNAKWAGACLVLCLFAYLNVRGIQVSGWLSVAMLVAVLLPALWLSVAALFHWQHNPLHPWIPPGQPFGSVFGEGLALAMWNYAGYEQLSSVTGEMRDPQKTFPRILLWNTPMNILTFTLPGGLAIAALGNWQQWQTGYIVDAAQTIGGSALGLAMLFASIIGTASLSNSTILYTTRIPAAMAQDGYLPAWLGKIHPRYGTPARAIGVSLIVYCLLARFQVADLVNIYIWARIATSLLTVLAVWGMRRKDPDVPRQFRVPGGSIGLAYSILFPALLCAVKIYYSEPFVWRWAPWLLATGPVAYCILRWGFGYRPACTSPQAARV
ncbi:MAG TPA: APC family permease [Candidatus Acidoferrum sp.]|nr:APC family permease [Candidatus Acidoferrum sp.]